jgi:hypothetical protein
VWDPQENWAQQGSFVSQVTPPAADPNVEPLVCVSFAAEWLPYVVGALQQLMQPTSWATTDPAVLSLAQERSTDLIALIGTAGPCAPMIQLRGHECVLQYSLDAGATWVDVPGWVSDIVPCFLPSSTVIPPATQVRVNGCELQTSDDAGTTWTDVDGWDNLAGPCFEPSALLTIPSDPQGVGTDQQACDISAYVATQVLEASVQHAVDQITAVSSLGTFYDGLVGLIPTFNDVTAVAVPAATNLWNDMLAGTLSHFTDALADGSLWSSIQCAIYNAIKAAGYFTAGNTATAIAAVSAVGFADTDVHDAVVAYLTDLGFNALAAIQIQGSTWHGDCSLCTGWCYEWTGSTINTPIWCEADEYGGACPSTRVNITGGQIHSLFVIGAVHICDFGYHFASTQIDTIELKYHIDGSTSNGNHSLAIGTTTVNIPNGPGDQDYTLAVPGLSTRININLDIVNGTAEPAGGLYFTSIKVRGRGFDPFPASNC